VHEIEGVGVDPVRDAFADEGRLGVRGGRGSVAVSSSTVFSGARSVAGSSIIRPATQVMLPTKRELPSTGSHRIIKRLQGINPGCIF
jgi:hypothetical protein